MSERFSAKGAALMRACGYKGHGGLGARERGREAPVEARVKRDRAGLGSAQSRAGAGARRTPRFSIEWFVERRSASRAARSTRTKEKRSFVTLETRSRRDHEAEGE